MELDDCGKNVNIGWHENKKVIMVVKCGNRTLRIYEGYNQPDIVYRFMQMCKEWEQLHG